MNKQYIYELKVDEINFRIVDIGLVTLEEELYTQYNNFLYKNKEKVGYYIITDKIRTDKTKIIIKTNRNFGDEFYCSLNIKNNLDVYYVSKYYGDFVVDEIIINKDKHTDKYENSYKAKLITETCDPIKYICDK